jgi:hypothetical protein
MAVEADIIPRPSLSAFKRPRPIRFCVADWMACAPGREEKEDWLAWAAGKAPRETGANANGAKLPPALRRRITPVGQMAFRAARGIGETPRARFIFSARHGEFRRTKALLETLARREEPSPAEFSLAVHNALAGILSIEWRNDAGHTAIAAGPDSFGFGLLEAAACLEARPEEPILLVYFDEPLPEEYAELGEGRETSLALALLLTAGPDQGAEVMLSFVSKARGVPARPSTDPALDFMRFLLSSETTMTSAGGAIEWRWHRDAA